MGICSGSSETGCPSFQRRRKRTMTPIRRSHAIIGHSSQKLGQSRTFSHWRSFFRLCPLSTVRITSNHSLHRWITSLPSHFQQCDLQVLDYVAQPPLPIYRKPWNEDCLIGWAAVGDRIKNQEEKGWYRERLAEAAENAKKGWYVDWDLIVCVGRKAT